MPESRSTFFRYDSRKKFVLEKPYLIEGPAYEVPAPGSKSVTRHRYVACSVGTYVLWVQQPSRVPKLKFRVLFSSIWISHNYRIDTENGTEMVLKTRESYLKICIESRTKNHGSLSFRIRDANYVQKILY